MNATDAKAELTAMVAASTAPTLTSGDLDRLLKRSEVQDAAGVDPGGTGYVPTYTYQSLNRAAAAGWREKAARLANDFDVELGSGKAFKRNQKIAACERMAARYEAKAGGTLTTIDLRSAGYA